MSAPHLPLETGNILARADAYAMAGRVIAEDGDGEQRHVAPTLRAAMGASPEPSEDWTAVLHELADLPCAEPEASGRAPGDETCSCYLECVGCRARRAVERLALREPSDEEVARELEAAWRAVGFHSFAANQGMEVVLQVNAACERARRVR